MDVLETKYLSRNENFLYETLQLGNNPIRLVGTGSMASQYYPADFDFLCIVKKKYTPEKLHADFKKIFNNISSRNNLFFIEFKLQELAKGDKDPVKHKRFNMNDVNFDFFDAFFNNNTELCKIDLLIYLDNGLFKEVSCIYFFSSQKLDMDDYIKALLEDQVHYYDEGKYYKSLKRIMLSAKYENPPDKNLIILITRFFNSAVGKLYERKNIIDAGIIFRDKFKSKQADNRLKTFMKNLGFDGVSPDKLKYISDDYGKLIDGEALKFYSLYKIPVGHLPRWNSIRPEF